MSAAAAAFWGGGGDWEGKIGPWAALKLDDLWFPGVGDLGSPGVCPVRIAGEVKYRIDSQKPKGKSGHKLVTEGYEPTKCVGEVRIYTAEQWAAFRAYLPEINPKLRSNNGRAYRARHPYLQAYDLSNVYINEITFPDEHDGRMVRMVKLSLWEVFGVQDLSASKTVKSTDGEIPDVIPEGRGIGGPQPQGTVFVEPRRP